MSDDKISISKEEYLRLMALDGAVRTALTQRGDDICWRDLYVELAKLVGIQFHPELICDKAHMMANCGRFIDSLRDGPYIPVYVEINPCLKESSSADEPRTHPLSGTPLPPKSATGIASDAANP